MTGKKAFVCQICQRGFTTDVEYAIHQTFAHRMRAPTCSVCLQKQIVDTKTIPPPQVDISRSVIAALQKRLRNYSPTIFEKKRKLVLIYPGGGILPIRAWPLESFCRLSATLVESGYSVGIIGLEFDKALADRIISHCGSSFCTDLTGFTKSVRELMVLFHLSVLLITNDGGPGQFAALCER